MDADTSVRTLFWALVFSSFLTSVSVLDIPSGSDLEQLLPLEIDETDGSGEDISGFAGASGDYARSAMERLAKTRVSGLDIPSGSDLEQLLPWEIDETEGSGEDISGFSGASFLGSGVYVRSAMERLAKSQLNEQTVGALVTATKTVLADMSDLGVLEVTQTVSILERATELPKLPRHTAQEVLEIVDTLSVVNLTGLDQAMGQDNLHNRLIRSVEELGRKVELDSYARLGTATTALEVWDISKSSEEDDFPLGLSLQAVKEEEEVQRKDRMDLVAVVEGDGKVTPYIEDSQLAIALNPSFLREVVNANPGEEVRMWMTVFSDTALFRGHLASPKNLSSQPRGRLNSKVISASVSVHGGPPVSHFPSSVVTSVFLPVVEVPDARRAELSRCVFWDLQGNEGRGGWSQQGCRYHGTQHGRDVCVCDHLTNFAVLLDFYGRSEQHSHGHQIALSLMSVVGLSFSICGLSCTVLTFIFIKKMHTVLPKQVLFNLALAMLLSWIIFLAGFSGAAQNDVGCITVAALLHYFILATFLWMLAEGAMQYMLLVKVHGQVRRFLLKAALFAWGTPVIPVLTILAVDLKLYKGYDKYCWMSLTPLYFGFLLPVGLVMLTNLIIYVLVVVSICRVKGRPGQGSNAKSRGVSIRASFACFVVLGLSWIFAFLAVENARLLFQYLFTATTAFQGLLIFVVFTARDPLVQDFCRDKLRKGMALVRSSAIRSQTRSTSTGSASRGREEAGVHQKSQPTSSSSGKKALGTTSSGGEEVGVQMEALPNSSSEKKGNSGTGTGGTQGEEIRVRMETLHTSVSGKTGGSADDGDAITDIPMQCTKV